MNMYNLDSDESYLHLVNAVLRPVENGVFLYYKQVSVAPSKSSHTYFIDGLNIISDTFS